MQSWKRGIYIVSVQSPQLSKSGPDLDLGGPGGTKARGAAPLQTKIKLRILVTIYRKIKLFFIHKFDDQSPLGHWRSDINCFLFFQHQNY